MIQFSKNERWKLEWRPPRVRLILKQNDPCFAILQCSTEDPQEGVVNLFCFVFFFWTPLFQVWAACPPKILFQGFCLQNSILWLNRTVWPVLVGISCLFPGNAQLYPTVMNPKNTRTLSQGNGNPLRDLFSSRKGNDHPLGQVKRGKSKLEAIPKVWMPVGLPTVFVPDSHRFVRNVFVFPKMLLAPKDSENAQPYQHLMLSNGTIIQNKIWRKKTTTKETQPKEEDPVKSRL